MMSEKTNDRVTISFEVLEGFEMKAAQVAMEAISEICAVWDLQAQPKSKPVKNLKIVKWLNDGDAGFSRQSPDWTVEEVLDGVGRMIDRGCSDPGSIVFITEDDKYRRITIEAVVDEISEKSARELCDDDVSDEREGVDDEA